MPIALRDLPSPGAYARLWRAALDAAAAGRHVRLRAWDADLAPDEVRPYFLRALNRRINERAGASSRGRNDTPDACWSFYRDALAARNRVLSRIRVYQFETRAARDRLGHLLGEREG